MNNETNDSIFAAHHCAPWTDKVGSLFVAATYATS